ncbi:MAG: polysaccharide deacetylase family protein, partial [Hamadaea sp.]|nr:polysaccharide deacetylase family protein [Hamadaea sp.]
RLPLDGGYAPAGNPLAWSDRGGVRVVWHVPTTAPVVALTFDDGPLPEWTPRVLDTLADLGAPATFFLVGERLREHAGLVRDRYDGHEIGNHSWSHADLARLDAPAALRQIRACHDEIARRLGRTARLLRPPWGHLGGSTLVAADALGYDVVLWSQRMREQEHEARPAGIVDSVVAEARPGAILLAHDVGARRRLVTVDHLAAVVAGLRAKGLRLVTVSQLLAAASPPSL